MRLGLARDRRSTFYSGSAITDRTTAPSLERNAPVSRDRHPWLPDDEPLALGIIREAQRGRRAATLERDGGGSPAANPEQLDAFQQINRRVRRVRVNRNRAQRARAVGGGLEDEGAVGVQAVAVRISITPIDVEVAGCAAGGVGRDDEGVPGVEGGGAG